ncbi:dTDP-4-dehydrorhamnose 3,5-epimerase [Patescibacteria group bacterium]|nr:dTDP-4-dehydrorhamnose 3,5-epimerase [Patescibacteria group bacterium]MBU1967328.1 dTDP-4-dehydrorhamnose 3,5-epimerase [Patescibacteria group bacterium]MBU2543243.1 dTDP-4-dehydrorhamnose 3,5-epimerase [Patescibacteria group bacterium]
MSVIQYDPTKAKPINNVFCETPFVGMFYMPLKVFEDDRGFFTEIGRAPEVEEVTKKPFRIAQLNLSLSKTNSIRGFHTEGWNKLATVIQGAAFCALVDIRPQSKTFGQAITVTLGRSGGAHFGSIYLPQGIANSFLVLKGPMLYSYAVDRLYKDRDQSGDVAISLFDPDIGVNWPIDKDQMIISKRDIDTITLREKYPHKF